MSGSLGDLGGLLRQAQQMQQRMAELREDLGKRRFEGRAGGDAVHAVVSGDRQLLELNIAPEVVDPKDVSMLEDLVMTAVGEALKQAAEAVEKEMGDMTGGLGLPGMM